MKMNISSFFIVGIENAADVQSQGKSLKDRIA